MKNLFKTLLFPLLTTMCLCSCGKNIDLTVYTIVPDEYEASYKKSDEYTTTTIDVIKKVIKHDGTNYFVTYYNYSHVEKDPSQNHASEALCFLNKDSDSSFNYSDAFIWYEGSWSLAISSAAETIFEPFLKTCHYDRIKSSNFVKETEEYIEYKIAYLNYTYIRRVTNDDYRLCIYENDKYRKTITEITNLNYSVTKQIPHYNEFDSWDEL